MSRALLYRLSNLSLLISVCSAQGLAERAQLQLMDYRHQQVRFDHIVSIEMFEAVGKSIGTIIFTQLKRFT